jgi:hypothetical protein
VWDHQCRRTTSPPAMGQPMPGPTATPRPAIKGSLHGGKTPFSSLPFSLPPEASAGTTHCRLAGDLAPHLTIPSSQRKLKVSQSSWPWFYSSCSSPSTVSLVSQKFSPSSHDSFLSEKAQGLTVLLALVLQLVLLSINRATDLGAAVRHLPVRARLCNSRRQ